MPNQIKAAVLATKVFEEYKKLWEDEFEVEAPNDARDSFKVDLMKGVLVANAKKSVGMNDFNFVLTRNNAHKILEFHQNRYVRLDDQDAILMRIWADIIMNVYGEKVDVDKKTPLDANLFNNMWPILENSLKVIAGIDLNKHQIECLDNTFDKYGYTANKKFEEKLQKIKESKVEFKRLSKQYEDRAKADQKKIAELEAEVKKYNKIFAKLKAAI